MACDKDVRIAAQAMTTDTASTFGAGDMMQVVGFDMARDAANKVYEAAGIGPDDLDVVELHDCFAHNELITYEGLGLCAEGEAARFIDDGDNTYGGQIVTNPSGGLLSKGHPLGATGLAQCYELTRQLRGTAQATPGRRRAHRPAAQSRPRRRLRRHALRARLRPRWSINPPSGVPSRRSPRASSPGACASSSTRSARPIRVYRDEKAAQAAGYGAAPVPPTYLFCLEMMDADRAVRVPDGARHRPRPRAAWRAAF